MVVKVTKRKGSTVVYMQKENYVVSFPKRLILLQAIGVRRCISQAFVVGVRKTEKGETHVRQIESQPMKQIRRKKITHYLTSAYNSIVK